MKKFLIFLIISALIIILGVGCFFLYKTTTPEYALVTTIKDIKGSGLDGLKEHLTSAAIDKIEAVEEWTDKSSILDVLTTITQDAGVSFLKSKLSETEWSIEDILKGNARTDVVIGFNYKDKIVGTIEITMRKENGQWKIDDLSTPSFDTISLW